MRLRIAKTTIGVTFQVEPHAVYLVKAILSPELRCIVRQDGCPHTSSGITTGQTSSYGRSIVDEGTESDTRFTTKVVVKTPSPSISRIPEEGTVGDGHFASIVKKA